MYVSIHEAGEEDTQSEQTVRCYEYCSKLHQFRSISLSARAICGFILDFKSWLKRFDLYGQLSRRVGGCSTMDKIYKQKSDPRFWYKLQKSQVGVLPFFQPTVVRWQIHCSETHSPGWATSRQVLLDRRRCSLANASGRVEFYSPDVLIYSTGDRLQIRTFCRFVHLKFSGLYFFHYVN